MIEKAVRITSPMGLTAGNVKGFDRIYFGNETCPARFPESSDIDFFLRFIELQKISGTILTPVISERFLDSISDSLSRLPSGFEIVFNDFGLFHRFSHGNFTPLMGRMLIPLKKDTAISPASDHELLSIYNEEYFCFMTNLGFQRFELDNIQYPFFSKPLKKNNFNFTLYLTEVITNLDFSGCVKCASTGSCIFPRKPQNLLINRKGGLESWPDKTGIFLNYFYYMNDSLTMINKKIINRLVCSTV